MIYYALDFSTLSKKDPFSSWIERTSLIHDYCKLKTPNRDGWVSVVDFDRTVTNEMLDGL